MHGLYTNKSCEFYRRCQLMLYKDAFGFLFSVEQVAYVSHVHRENHSWLNLCLYSRAARRTQGSHKATVWVFLAFGNWFLRFGGFLGRSHKFRKKERKNYFLCFITRIVVRSAMSSVFEQIKDRACSRHIPPDALNGLRSDVTEESIAFEEQCGKFLQRCRWIGNRIERSRTSTECRIE